MKATLAILLSIVIAGYLVLAQSSVSSEYLCSGETSLKGFPAEADAGRLQLNEYRWWVSLWNASDGNALFQSKKVTYFLSTNLRTTGDGNFAIFASFDDQKVFFFQRATGELVLQELGQELGRTFKGECNSI